MLDPIEVHVVERAVYRFPDPTAKCPAHGPRLCVECARNPSTCMPDEVGVGVECSYYQTAGMHWDTCPNRIHGPL